MDEADYFESLQSGFRPEYGMETALVILSTLGWDEGGASILPYYDLSMDFSIIDHGIFLDCLRGTCLPPPN